ncbi:DUF2089 family protein [Enterococcus hirae]|uniref:DUF2089 family protein n=1 Tax=Enterococcus hirae TaxID=1354 RepID=UPI0019E19599|nr:DUF2089 family protein [Enterococcus hirae]EMF0122259.1 DUF2089 family protein [Enterococcus hirae]EMF0141884.1 DUF2089 family protein [Enterococcus hirae]EMF0164464.1 DUF2089 family protein [Enterococcus hirae]MCA6767355.1 DUF2089 domain-containing protein [Enterococcus hirae]
MEWFFNLEPEEQVFIKKFLLASGSLKQLAKEYEFSYPTVRLRLDRLIEKIKLFDIKQEDSFEVSMMQLVINEKISLDVAKEIIKKHRESIDE